MTSSPFRGTPEADPPEGSQPIHPLPVAVDEKATGLPLLHSWAAVYAFVVGVFVLWVALLTWFMRAFT